MKILFLFAAVVGVTGMAATPANAQSTRTWVSGGGDDTGSCTRAAPCKTFAGAISKTMAGGEINCVDSGGYGTVTITKALSIICPVGEAGVLVASTDGIIVNAGAGDIVHLSGLDIEGLATGLSGINIIQAGHVRIDHSTIRGFTTAAVYVQLSGGSGSIAVDVIDSVIADNPGSGIRAKPSGGASVAMLIDHTTVSQNTGDGVMANGTLTTGSISVVVRDSISAFNGQCGFIGYSNGAATQVVLARTTAFSNTNGVLASGPGSTVFISGSVVRNNGTGVSQTSSGAALSYGNNVISGNGNNGSFGTAPALQ